MCVGGNRGGKVDLASFRHRTLSSSVALSSDDDGCIGVTVGVFIGGEKHTALLSLTVATEAKGADDNYGSTDAAGYDYDHVGGEEGLDFFGGAFAGCRIGGIGKLGRGGGSGARGDRDGGDSRSCV